MTQYLAIAQVDSSSDIGGVGINRYYLDGGAVAFSDTVLGAWAILIMDIYTAISAVVPGSVTYTFQPTVKIVEATSGGLITEVLPSAVPSPVVGEGTSGYAGGSGARVYWHTGTVHGRRFIRGATYLTPLASAAYDSSGGIASSVVTTIQGAAEAYVAAAALVGGLPVIWHRPLKGATTGGVTGQIVAASVSQQPGSLRSRRSN